MNRHPCLWFTWLLLAMLVLVPQLPAQTATDLNEGSRLEYDSTNAIWRFKWWGRAGISYFPQHSEDLVNWSWVPIIEPGDDSIKEWGFTTTGDRFFMRLKFSDIPTSDPDNADFDEDEVPNLFEIQNGFSPFAISDSDQDGLPDEWELYHDSSVAIFASSLELVLNWGEATTQQLLLNNATGAPVNFSGSIMGAEVSGYSWEDSVSGSIVYTWNDISTTGTPLSTIADVDSDSEKIVLSQFTFPFYGRDYSEIYVCTNGYLNFQSEFNDSSNERLPDIGSPRGMIAAFWDDLDTGLGGDIYYLEEATRLIVQYEAVAKDDGSGANTFQIILNAGGSIEFHYKQTPPPRRSCTPSKTPPEHSLGPWSNASTIIPSDNSPA